MNHACCFSSIGIVIPKFSQSGVKVKRYKFDVILTVHRR